MSTTEPQRPNSSSGFVPPEIDIQAGEILERLAVQGYPSAVLSVLAVVCVEDSKRWFPGHTNDSLMHHALSLCGEVGEVANIVKKIDRGDLTVVQAMNEVFMAAKDKDSIGGELADVLIYLMNLAGLLNIDLYAEFAKKRTINEARWGNK